jgi:histidinol dehydrogenase
MRLIRTQGRAAKKFAELLAKLENRSGSSLETVLPAVRKILRKVREDGDKALLRYAQKFDGLEGKDSDALRVSPEETAAAWQQLDPALKEALEIAAANIRAFAERQLPQSWSFEPSFPKMGPKVGGLTTGQLVRPLESVGCYVPGGRHPLPSTMLMTVIPAQVAGVGRIVVTSPRPALETLATAHLLGIAQFYRIGGAHAVAALAYGTKAIPRVAKIVGPGNLYVTAAKREVAFECAIDMLAGPTEIVVISDLGDPAGIASDLIAQAEHDPETLAIFITPNQTLAMQVMEETQQRSRRNSTAKQALTKNGFVLLAATPEEAQAITNRLAPEHLTIDSEADLAWVRNAGSVFIGQHSPQPMGDYISGPNHTLPTGGMASVRGGLSVNDFVKLITVQQYTADGLAELGPHAIRMAEAEGLTGHAEAIRSRMQAPTEIRKGAKA